jgi:hypothetical protein
MNADPEYYARHTLDRLPLLPRGISVRQFSSHSRMGVNRDSDGFLYTDDRGDHVIFDAIGPGCLRSMWSTNIPENQVLLFYFDDDPEPRYGIPTREFYKGQHTPFDSPLNSYEKVGYYGDMPFAGNSFMPIPFAGALRIAVRGEVCFHHILYEQYPYGTHVATFSGQEDRGALLQAFSDGGQAFCPSDLESVVTEVPEFQAGEALVLLNRGDAGTVRRIVIEADGSEAFVNGVMLQMRWDNARFLHVKCPIGHFFGTPLRADNVSALPVQASKRDDGRVVLTCWFPMPYWSGAQIELVNTCGHSLGPIRAEIGLQKEVTSQGQSGHFCTHYREGQTDYGRDWLFFSGPGTGWFVGVVQTMLGDHYCEGDEHFSLDGACSPQINGTGSEDYYLACFWPNRDFSLPFAGCVGDAFKDGGGYFRGAYRYPGRYYRFHLDAPIPFYSHADLRIQHGGESHIRSQYSSLAFIYLSPVPAHRKTDFLKVMNRESEVMHNYVAGESREIAVESPCEGDLHHFRHRDIGRIHAGGDISFSVSVDPENEGVRIRRRLDQATGRQRADVFVDDDYVGTWYHADHNPYLRWFDSDFDIHPKFTRGKERLNIRLSLGQSGCGRFTDFNYDVYSVRYGDGDQSSTDK